MKFLQRTRGQCDILFRLHPSLMTLCSLLPVLLTALLTGWGTLALTGIVLFLTGIFILLTGVRHTFFRTVLPCFLLLCSLAWHKSREDSDSLNRILGFRQSAGVRLTMTLCDETFFRTGPEGEGTLLDAPRSVLCRVTSLGFSEGDVPIPLSGKVLLILPERLRKIPLCYGMRLAGKGTLKKVDPPLLEELFDYRKYLAGRHVYYQFYPENLTSPGPDPSFRTQFFRFRDRILESVLKGIPDSSARALAAGMLFGCRQGISYESRKEFLRSGLIHIFTVSGLHIGLFASGVFLLLIFLPLQWRTAAGLVLVWVYGLMTGLQMPSLRALIMLSCWGVPRIFLLGGGGLNSIFFAGSILLILNGFQIREAGFQYSFLCVIFLVTAGKTLSQFFTLLREKEYFRPPGKYSLILLYKNTLIHRILGFLAGCLAAWVCSFLLTLFHQSMSIHLAGAANLFILLLAYGVFLIFTVFFPLVLLFPETGKICGFLLQKLLFLTEKICVQFGEWSGETAVSAPGVFWIAGALVLALYGLCFPGRKRAVYAFTALGCLILLYFCTSALPGNELILISGSGTMKGPLWCISMPRNGFCAAGNIPDYRTAAELHQYLRRRGHSSLTLLALSGTERSLQKSLFISGFMPLENLLHFRKTLSPYRFRRQPGEELLPGTRIFHSHGKTPFRLRHGGMFFEILQEKERISFDIQQNADKISFRLIPAPEENTFRKEKHPAGYLCFTPGKEHGKIRKRIPF